MNHILFTLSATASDRLSNQAYLPGIAVGHRDDVRGRFLQREAFPLHFGSADHVQYDGVAQAAERHYILSRILSGGVCIITFIRSRHLANIVTLMPFPASAVRVSGAMDPKPISHYR